MESFDDAKAWEIEARKRGLVVHHNGAPADPENGPSADEIPTALIAYEDGMDEAGFKCRGWFELEEDPDRPADWARGYLFDSFEEMMAFTDDEDDEELARDEVARREALLAEEADETRGDLGGDTIYVSENGR